MSLAAVNPRTNATVFASAGTGKTWLLVARLARLLLAGATPGSILAVTFTKKAAGEMQERLMERLEHWAVCDDLELQASLQEIGADTESSTVTRARCLYEELLATGHPVRLTTFHAFCNELLSQFPLEANIPPGYELIENTQELQDEAWEMLMRETREDTHPDLYATMKQLLQGVGSMSNMQTALEAFFNQRSDWWAYTEGHDAPLRWALEQLPGLFDCDPDDDPYEGICHPRWLDHFEEYARLLQADKANKTMKTNGAAIKAALDGKAPPQVLIEAVITAAKTNKGEPRKTSASKAYQKANGAEDSEALERLHAEINGRLDDFIEHNNRLANLQLNGVWYQAGTRYLEHYQNLKLQQRQLDFADMEWQAYRLLNRSDDASWVQYKLDQRIDHLLIDEFQDTNPTQWRLLKPLLEEFAGGDPERQRSAFLVGDTKQSIYSFRRANPRLQDTAAEWLKTHLNSKASGMDKSRRSSAAIMQAVNAVFSASPFDSQIPRFTPHDTYLDQLWGRVELYPAFALPKPEEPACDPGLRDPITTPRAEKPSVKALEADFIARRITALIEDKTPIGPAGEARPVTYGNITILLRTRNAAPEIERALRSHNIPYQGTARGKFLPRLEITDIRALLKVLHSPQDNLALAQVLKSPIFDFSDEDLVKLAVGLKHPIDPASPKPMHWFDVLQGLAGEDGAATHFRDAITLLEGWRHDYANLPLHDLLEKIYFEGDVLARYHAASPSWQQNQVRANLKRLVEIALELDSGRYPSLNRFLGRLDDLENSSAAPSEPQPDHANAPVQILTIHESKGLEAPVIFYADLAAQGQQDKAWGAIVEWPPEAERPEAILLQAKKEQLDSISRRYIEHREQRQYEEAGNLTYVALTRARQILILSASR
ncbi:MAG: UvrD-helicase domain-containing protein, partial [bacterium]